MLRLLGGVLLLASAFWLGRHASLRLRQRPRQLRSLIDALEILHADISALTPLSEAMLRASGVKGCGGAFLKRIACRLEQENRILFRNQVPIAIQMNTDSILTEYYYYNGKPGVTLYAGFPAGGAHQKLGAEFVRYLQTK